MSSTATATSGKNEQWGVTVHMSIKDPQTAAQRMGWQMEEIKFEYINEEEQACRHGGRGKIHFEKEVSHRTGRISENPKSLQYWENTRKGKELMIYNFKN